MKLTKFTLDVPQSELDDLRRRLQATRWPNEPQPEIAPTGPSMAFMKDLTRYWLDTYDWRAAEARINAFNHVLAEVNGLSIHAIHEKSAENGSVPILLLHGWADSFYRFVHLIDNLTGNDGLPEGQAFDVVVPSLPGFDFSNQPGVGAMSPVLAADAVAGLMAGLGYDRYYVHGGDWGSAVAQEVARNHGEHVIGLHLTDIPFGNMYLIDREEAGDTEKEFIAEVEAWGEYDSAYVTIQATKPLMLSYGLSDSPVGLAAWLLDHFQRLSETTPSHDDLITNVMLYWLNNTIRSSMRYYNEGMAFVDTEGDWSADAQAEAAVWGDLDTQNRDWGAAEGSSWDSTAGAGGWSMQIAVPTALALFPMDISHAPREYAERFFDIRRYVRMPNGGHFAALEVPDLVANDIRAFAAELG